MPGFNTKAPFVTTMVQIVVRPKTDTMNPIVSITKDGISNTFNNVQVIATYSIPFFTRIFLALKCTYSFSFFDKLDER